MHWLESPYYVSALPPPPSSLLELDSECQSL
jgi:hypothetical protein